MLRSARLDDRYQGDLIEVPVYFPEVGGRVVFDGVTENGSTTVWSAKARFTQSDVDKKIWGATLQSGTTIESVSADGTEAVLSDAATDDGENVTLLIRAVDRSEFTFEAPVKKSPTSDTVLTSWDVDDTDITDGYLVLSIAADVSATLPSITRSNLIVTAADDPTYEKTWASMTLVLKPRVSS